MGSKCFENFHFFFFFWNGYFVHTWLMSWYWNLSGEWLSLRTLRVLLFFFSCVAGENATAILDQILCMCLIFLFLEASTIFFLLLIVGNFIMVHSAVLSRSFSVRKLMPFHSGKLSYISLIYCLSFSFLRTLVCWILNLLFWFSNFFSFFWLLGAFSQLHPKPSV